MQWESREGKKKIRSQKVKVLRTYSEKEGKGKILKKTPICIFKGKKGKKDLAQSPPPNAREEGEEVP